MAKIPEFLLRALYLKGSLKNNDSGFEFQMKNDLGPVRIVGAMPLIVDRKPVSLDACHFVHGEQQAGFSEVSEADSVLMRKGEAITVLVEGTTLASGRRTVGINVEVKDMGQVRFSFSDKVD